jgi:hypothetical protein
MKSPLPIVLDTNVLVTDLGEWVIPTHLVPEPAEILDPFDLPFAETTVADRVQALITGNPRHFVFLNAYAFQVLTPVEFLT